MSSLVLAKRRKITGNLAALFFSLIILAVIDGLAAEMRGEFNRFDLVPGASLAINGPMPPMTAALADIRQETNAPPGTLTLTPDDSYSGFWYGGGMWKGILAASAQAAPGRYSISLRGLGNEAQNPALVYAVVIHPDQATLRQSAVSYAMRFIDMRPFALAALLLPFALVFGAISYRLSFLLDKSLAAEGKAEIYLFKPAAEGTVIGFAPPGGVALEIGSEVLILSASGQELCRAVVQESDGKSARALAPAGVVLGPGLTAQVSPGLP